MQQYLELCERILTEGVWKVNERTGKRCLTVVNATFNYNVEDGIFPLITLRKGFYKSAIAELLGYLRGYDNAAQFRALGTKTWDANANETKAWLDNPARKGVDDMGRVYGVQGRRWKAFDGTVIDQVKKVVTNLTNKFDDRGEIITFYNPGEFHLGCLRPCMHTHQFSLLDDELYLTSFQRSVDVPLGLGGANMVQVYTLLALMAQITGTRPKLATHHMVDCHIYEDQIPMIKELVKRQPFPSPQLIINPKIRSLSDLESWVTLDDFKVENYQHHEPISFPFSA